MGENGGESDPPSTPRSWLQSEVNARLGYRLQRHILHPHWTINEMKALPSFVARYFKNSTLPLQAR